MLHRHLPEIDVLEVYNARLLFDTYNDEALRFARKYGLLQGAGSDAHVLQGVGTGALRLRRFDGPEEFLLALRTATVLRRPKSLALPAVAQVGGPGRRRSPGAAEAPLEEADTTSANECVMASADERPKLVPGRAGASPRRRDPGAVSPARDLRDQRARRRAARARRRAPRAGARQRPSARRRLAPQAPPTPERDPGGRRVLRPGGPGAPQVARSGSRSTRSPSTARTASSSDGGAGGGASLADPRAPHRAAEAPRRDGRRDGRVRRTGSSSRSPRRSTPSASARCSASRRRSTRS